MIQKIYDALLLQGIVGAFLRYKSEKNAQQIQGVDKHLRLTGWLSKEKFFIFYFVHL